MASITIDTADRTSISDITDRVENALSEDATGVCTVFSRHTTMGVIVNENESRLLADLAKALDQFVPDEGWTHDALDDNADSHIRAMLLGESVTVPVEAGALQLGRWQSVLCVECDGPRTRTLDILIH